jgi:outer membrane protein OmpA-like peptidoglycan-associated protein
MTLRLLLGAAGQPLRPLDTNVLAAGRAARDAEGNLHLSLGEGVLFDFDKDVLKPEAARVLAHIKGTELDPQPSALVRVEGYTDDRGSDAYNLDLSQRRAQTVGNWLVGHAVDSQRLSTVGLGKQKPRLPNSNDFNRAANRRVELVIASGNALGSGDQRPEARFVGVAEGVVQDKRSGLSWQKQVDAGTYAWDAATRYCARLSLGPDRRVSWRVPTIEELQSIVDNTRSQPSIDSAAFPNTPPESYWSSSPYAGNPGRAWSVGFANGVTPSNGHIKSNACRVRCVH